MYDNQADNRCCETRLPLKFELNTNNHHRKVNEQAHCVCTLVFININFNVQCQCVCSLIIMNSCIHFRPIK